MANLIAGLLTAIAAVIMILAMLAFAALFGGTLLWFLWPVVMVPVFHAPALTWAQSVALVYIFAILLKPSSSK